MRELMYTEGCGYRGEGTMSELFSAGTVVHEILDSEAKDYARGTATNRLHRQWPKKRAQRFPGDPSGNFIEASPLLDGKSLVGCWW